MTRPAVHRPVPSRDDGALAVVAVPRAFAGGWPGGGPVAQVPAVLLLAMTGSCCCDDCVDEHVRRTRRAGLQLV